MNKPTLYLLGVTAMLLVCYQANGFKEVCFKGCRKVYSFGKTTSCGTGEVAVRCYATGFGGCGSTQTYNAKGCKRNSCGFRDNGYHGKYRYTPWPSRKIIAICCEETDVSEHNWTSG